MTACVATCPCVVVSSNMKKMVPSDVHTYKIAGGLVGDCTIQYCT